MPMRRLVVGRLDWRDDDPPHTRNAGDRVGPSSPKCCGFGAVRRARFRQSGWLGACDMACVGPSRSNPGAANPFEGALAAHLDPFATPSPAATITDPDETLVEDDEVAPSREDLLQRAAALGNARMTWESIVLQPTDPILQDKMQPRVAERRARFRRMVKVGLGACVAFCLVATAATALSSGTPSQTASSVAKTAPAVGVVTIEKLDLAARAKATGHVTAAARPATLPAWKAKRH
jgi:hypothetical protein